MKPVIPKRNKDVSDRKQTRFSKLVPQSKWPILAIIVCAVVGYGWQNDWFGNAISTSTADLLTYRVEPRDLPITVIERGNLESQTNIKIICEVDDYRSDGILGTPIVWVIPNGTSVTKGDLICELDSTAIQSELDEQTLDTEEARSAHIQAEANYQNQEIKNLTAADKAKLDIELATLELEMFEDDAKGSHQLALEAVERQIDDVNNQILAAEMSLKLRRNEKVGIESLFKLGYAGKSEMDRSVLGYLQAEGDYAAKLNKLQTQIASREKLDSYDKDMKQLTLKGKLSTAHQNLKQTLMNNRARMAQMKGILTSRVEQLKKEEERFERYTTQLSKCKIYASQDGMVAYATPTSSRDSAIADGVPVRPRQHILSIPNLQSMQVKTSVHESVLDRIQAGLQVSITVDAFPDKKYAGTVESVAVLPKQNRYSDTKVYETVVTIDESVYQLKPGMTAVCEINVDYLPDVNSVPIQAVVQRDGANWLYVQDEHEIERREVLTGASNDQHVVITEGIQIGDLVVLNPGLINDDATTEVLAGTSNPPFTDSAERLVAATRQPMDIN